MGAHLSKGGVAVEGKAVADPAAAKANGQVSKHPQTSISRDPHGTQRPPAAWVPPRGAELLLLSNINQTESRSEPQQTTCLSAHNVE